MRPLVAAAVILVTTAAARGQSCPPGTLDSPSAPGHCCWPGQIYSVEANACRGLPQCPAGYQPVNETCQWVGAPVVQPPPPMAPGPQVVPIVGPDGTPKPEKPLRWLGWTGFATLIASYAVSVFTVFATINCSGSFRGAGCRSYSGWLFVPVVGPWMSLGINAGDPQALNGEILWYVIAGVLETAGLAAMIGGFAYSKPAQAPARRLSLVPAGPGGPGLSLVGRW